MNDRARTAMKSFLVRSTVVISASLLIASNVVAGTKGRIIPDGSVSLQKNGTVSKFNEQTVLDENALIACDGNCMVKLQGVSLVAVNQSKFAIMENGDLLNLYVEQGRVSFLVSDTSQAFAFYTPDHRFVKTEGFVAPASTDNSVKGYINTTDKTVEIGMERGGMLIQTENGPQTINAGQSIQLAQADVPSNTKDDDQKGAGAVAGGGGAAAGATAEAAGTGLWTSLGTGGQILAVGVGVGTGVWLASETIFKNDDDAPPPPPVPEPPRPRPPSPNM